MLIFQHEKSKIGFEPLEYRNYQFSSFLKEYDKFWNTESTILSYVDHRRYFSRTKLPLNGRQRELALDLLAHSMIYHFFNSRKDAIEYWHDFFKRQDEWLKGSKSDIGSLLEQFVDEFFIVFENSMENRLKRELGEKTDFIIEQSMISSYLQDKKRNGEIGSMPKTQIIEEIMMGLGFTRLVKAKKVFWTR
jgi:hypothetical protein